MQLQPNTPEELAAALQECADSGRGIRLGGNFSKDRMGGPIAPADVTISTSTMNRVLIFEPRDLTISVEAGMSWTALTRLLDDHQMMVPLDPPAFASATVGGVVASNSSGPRRRGYGTARDVVIGMKFATLEGRIIQSGGMVVKNVAGLDMAKLMIGSFGTLTAIVSVNFKLAPKPPESLTFLFQCPTLEATMAVRNRLIRGVVQPVALDILNPDAAAALDLDGWVVLAQAAATGAVVARWRSELSDAAEIDNRIWERVRELAPSWTGAVIRISCTLEGVADAFRAWSGPMLARAGNGVCYGFAPEGAGVPQGVRGLVEWGGGPDAWPATDSDFPVMQKVKNMLDPRALLNRGRLYGRI